MICVHVTCGKAFVWNGNDACHLREEHRVIGSLVGCLPRLPRQNVQLGLPLQLMAEEVTLLLDKGVIKLLDDSQPMTLPSTEDIQGFKDRRTELYRKQIELCKQESKERILQKLPEIIAGQTKKRRRQLAERRATGEVIDDTEFVKEAEVDPDSISIPPLPEKHSCVQIHTACPRVRDLPPAAWSFPQTDAETLRCRVFRDLWERGHWLTSGCKFGGDFLVYPGDPGRFHSFYIAICLPFNAETSSQDILTFSRLGSNVKKTIVLCSVDDRDDLRYTSLQWTGIK